MDVTPLIPLGRQMVESYGNGRFRVSGTVWEGSILVLPDETFAWPVGAFADLTEESLRPVLAAQPEFERGARLKGLIELTEKQELLAHAVGQRQHAGQLQITIGGENASVDLADFTLVTAEYRVGGLQGVIGVIGPTRMPYEKVVAIVDYTSSLVTRILET